MAAFEPVTTWKVDGLANMLVACGMPEGHPWFDHIMRVGTHFCGVTHGVDSVSEMVEQGLSAKFLKAVKAEFPEFPPMKQKKLREVLVEMRRDSTGSDESSVSSVTSKRGRKSKFADDSDIEWVTQENPHKCGTYHSFLWDAAYGAENRGDFLFKIKDARVEFELLDARASKNAPASGYFSYLVKAGHIIVKA